MQQKSLGALPPCPTNAVPQADESGAIAPFAYKEHGAVSATYALRRRPGFGVCLYALGRPSEAALRRRPGLEGRLDAPGRGRATPFHFLLYSPSQTF